MFFGLDNNSIMGRGPTDDFWYTSVGAGMSAAGVSVTPETAMRLATVYSCVRNIAEDIGKLPFPMYRREANDGRARVVDHPIAILMRQPNKSQTGGEWRQMGQAHIELRGNFYNRIIYKGSRVIALHPIHPDCVTPELLPDWSMRYKVRNPRTSETETLVQAEVLHIRALACNGPVGLNPIEANREALGEALATQNYSSAFWKNDARPGLWLKHPTAFRDENARTAFMDAFKARFTGSGRGSVWLSEHGIELQQIQVKNSDAQYIESRKFQREEIAGIFRMPPHKVGIMDKATFSNIEQQAIEYVVDCLHGRCRRWEDAIAAQLLSDAEQNEFYFEFLLAELLRGETKSRFESYGLGINAGWLLRSEARKMENLNPVTGMERPLLPLNTVQLDAQGNPPPADPAPAPNPGSQQNPPGKSAREQALNRAAAERVIRKETAAIGKAYERGEGFAAAAGQFYAAHIDYVAEVMAIPREAAAKYAEDQHAEILAALRIEASSRAAVVPAMLEGWRSKKAAALAALAAAGG